MFVNVEEVTDITGIDVERSDIIRAQAIVEAFIGRNESEIYGADDKAIMGKAVAFQAVYMKNNYERVYEQVAVTQMGQIDGQMSLDRNMAAPFIAPLAVLALRHLSWRRSRSVKTGKMFGRNLEPRWDRQ